MEKLRPTVQNIDMLLCLTPMAELKKAKLRANVEVGDAIVDRFAGVLSDKQRSKFTMTDLCDVTKEIKFKVLDQKKVKAPMIDEVV